MKIYTLTEYDYDWYEFSEFKFASRKINVLSSMVQTKEFNPNGYEVVYEGISEEDDERVREMIENQKTHFRIREVELV